MFDKVKQSKAKTKQKQSKSNATAKQTQSNSKAKAIRSHFGSRKFKLAPLPTRLSK